MILVTLLGKASLWADPEGSFQVLSARLELCHPSPCCQHGPIPSGCGSGAVPQTFTPAHHQGGNTDITALRHTLTHTHTLTKIVAHIQFHIAPLHHCTTANGLFSRRPLPSNTPHPSPLSYVFPLSPPSRRLPGSKERLHTHIHPTMPLRVIRMSLFTSWSVQVVGKQIQSLPDYVSRSPTLTSIHLLSVWNAQGSNAFAANIATIIYCTYNAFKIFGVKFKDKFKIIENNLIVFMHLAVVRITSFGIEESFFGPDNIYQLLYWLSVMCVVVAGCY